MDGTGETDACRPMQTAGSAMAEAESQTLQHCEEQRGCLDFYETVLHCRLTITSFNHNDCNGDRVLCIFPLNSMT